MKMTSNTITDENRQVPPRVRMYATLIADVLLAAVLLAAVPGAAHAADSDAVTWSVQPADGSAPDGRPWVERTMDPGETVTEHLAVHNFSDREVTFRLTAADGFFNQNGRFNILAAGEQSTEAGTWIDIPDSVTVAAGQTEIVGFDVDVPSFAEPGDHAAGVAASISSNSTDDAGAVVGVESRIGFRVMVRVTGDVAAAAVLENVTTSYHTSWNPLVPGSVTIEFDARNVGNVRVKASGHVMTGGQTAQFPPADQPQELLAGDTRHFSVTVGDVWPLVLVGGTLTVDLATAVAGDSTLAADPVRTDFTVIAVPWPQAAVVVALILLVVAVVWRRRRTRDRWTARVESARREGREEALAENEIAQ